MNDVCEVSEPFATCLVSLKEPRNTSKSSRWTQKMFGDQIVEIDMEEENFAVSSSSAEDSSFDSVIGCIEDIILAEDFQQLQESFMEKHYLEFDDCEENKLTYTTIFNEYVNLLEKHLEDELVRRIPGFNMSTFKQLLTQHEEEVPGEIFEMLLTFTDFSAFKDMLVAYRAEKEGRGVDLSKALVVTSLTPAGFKHANSTQL